MAGLDTRTFDGGLSCESAKAIAFPHGFFSNIGGVSTGIYESLNCGPGSGDDAGNVAENRRRVASVLSNRRRTSIISAYQIHSAACVYMDGDWGEDRPRADALVTDQPGVILGVLTADCTPIIFADVRAGVIGVAHAGWKGAFSGIISATIQTMIERGASRSHINAAFGPTIQQGSYEIDTDFRRRFIDANPANEVYFVSGKDRGHYQFDLPAYVHAKLVEEEIATIEGSNTNTYSSDRHFSYRRTTHRGESDYGRQISCIMIPV